MTREVKKKKPTAAEKKKIIAQLKKKGFTSKQIAKLPVGIFSSGNPIIDKLKKDVEAGKPIGTTGIGGSSNKIGPVKL